MKKNTLLAVATAAILSAAVSADSPGASFEWLVGHWCSDADGEFIEEQWLGGRGDILLGLSRTVKGDRTKSFEFMRIETREGIRFIAQPQGRPPTEFRLTASGEGWARFENPAHDFPNRVEYRRTATGLHAEIAGPGKDGKVAVIPFEYTACPP